MEKPEIPDVQHWAEAAFFALPASEAILFALAELIVPQLGALDSAVERALGLSEEDAERERYSRPQ